MTIFETIVIAVVEGLTEFLPISSTGHMIIASSILHISTDPFTKLFEIAIQFGHSFSGGFILEEILLTQPDEFLF